jgi:hypothetical protein
LAVWDCQEQIHERLPVKDSARKPPDPLTEEATPTLLLKDTQTLDRRRVAVVTTKLDHPACRGTVRNQPDHEEPGVRFLYESRK